MQDPVWMFLPDQPDDGTYVERQAYRDQWYAKGWRSNDDADYRGNRLSAATTTDDSFKGNPDLVRSVRPDPTNTADPVPDPNPLVMVKPWRGHQPGDILAGTTPKLRERLILDGIAKLPEKEADEQVPEKKPAAKRTKGVKT